MHNIYFNFFRESRAWVDTIVQIKIMQSTYKHSFLDLFYKETFKIRYPISSHKTRLGFKLIDSLAHVCLIIKFHYKVNNTSSIYSSNIIFIKCLFQANGYNILAVKESVIKTFTVGPTQQSIYKRNCKVKLCDVKFH